MHSRTRAAVVSAAPIGVPKMLRIYLLPPMLRPVNAVPRRFKDLSLHNLLSRCHMLLSARGDGPEDARLLSAKISQDPRRGESALDGFVG